MELNALACCVLWFVFFQAEDGIRYLVRSRGLGDVYKRQGRPAACGRRGRRRGPATGATTRPPPRTGPAAGPGCLLYTSDAADERSSVDLGGRRIIKKTKTVNQSAVRL